MANGQVEKAKAAMDLLDIDQTSLQVPTMQQDQLTFKEKICDPANYKPFLSGFLLMAFFQVRSTSLFLSRGCLFRKKSIKR
jgi:hypothetical protein